MVFMREAVLYQNIDLTGPWQGWKIRGQYLVAPDRSRIMVRELIGFLLHYRAKFGHHRTKAKPLPEKPSNVIAFGDAAMGHLSAKYKQAEIDRRKALVASAAGASS